MSNRIRIPFALFIIFAGALALPMHLTAMNPASATNIPSHPIPLAEQIAVVVAEFLIKPTYMLVALGIIITLRHSRALDLVSLRWSMIFFLAGEIFCAFNLLFFDDLNVLLEYGHSYGMALCIGTLAFALFYALDSRVIKYSDPATACAAISLCRECSKYSNITCRARRVFLALGLAIFALAFLPLTATIQSTAYTSTVFGVPHLFSHADIHQWFEIRFSPWVALILSALAILILLLAEKNSLFTPKLILSASIGFLGFSFFRLVLFAPYLTNLGWFFFWEEMTELIFILGVAWMLWIFRQGLFTRA